MRKAYYSMKGENNERTPIQPQKRPVAGPRHKGIECEVIDWIQLALGVIQIQALVNMKIRLRIP
jgi:hypothetical protein